MGLCMDANSQDTRPPPEFWVPWAAAEIARRDESRVTAYDTFWCLFRIEEEGKP